MADIEMTIDSVRTSLMNYQRTLILKEKEAERYLPIWIGPAEAEAIAIKLQGVQCTRPLTHDFICTLIDTLGASLKSIVINNLEDNLFYAKVVGIAQGQQGGQGYEDEDFSHRGGSRPCNSYLGSRALGQDVGRRHARGRDVNR